MHRDLYSGHWTPVCKLDDIVPNTGVCALINGEQVAVFHISDGQQRLFAIDNYDANAGASVLSRGLIGSIGERIVVASPIYKQHFDLLTGECLEAPEHSVATWPVKLENGRVWVGA
ncbi:nitrite reductase small subunit NirD [Janthinobacterium agaricidamnosum]|uniref:Nitrite reductase [NAD(P)H] small subunit n=1 Tax=Janthinobacterium agaricidamnosum NBRC 102515 = DSM 9628 TaxID=1349767 RepID=W0V6T6_9BURK|nr:nitrite reductase small subunit NirD [Janthinobacterium agaricidamnosum]CDG83596.1 nitrite reductase [NAD(P)H] small subunit [Janthinobacterium agaricidamnosum NBRC 102515 = DSM 9628]